MSTSDVRRIFPHLLSADDILGPGPSPWQLCLSCGLRYIGIELKPSYARVAVRNLQAAAVNRTQGTLLPDEATA